jgi:DNA cross-link repair 1A protein
MELLDNNPYNCNVHVMPLQTITSERLLEYLEHWKGRWNKVLGFRPTGWTSVFDAVGYFGLSLMDYRYTPPAGTDTGNLQNIINRNQKRMYNWASLRPMRNSSPSVMLYGVPYSEHRFADLPPFQERRMTPISSSFFELTCFALSTQYVKMIATVNVGSAKSRAKMDGWFEKWEIERRRRDKEKADNHSVVAFRDKEYW